MLFHSNDSLLRPIGETLMRYVAPAFGETGSLTATKLVAPIGERRPSACFFNFGASLPRYRLQLAGFHPSLRASWPKNEKGPPMNVPAFARQCLAHRYTLITRSECGCAASILHNAQESSEAATRVMIDGMRQGRRVECLPALVAAEIPWTCTIHQLEGAQESAA